MELFSEYRKLNFHVSWMLSSNEMTGDQVPFPELIFKDFLRWHSCLRGMKTGFHMPTLALETGFHAGVGQNANWNNL